MPRMGDGAKKSSAACGEAPCPEIPGAAQTCIHNVDFRVALVADSLEIARHMCAAGGGLYEFLFNDLIPFVTATEFLVAGVASDEYPISYRNCFVAAKKEDGRVIGAANAFPATAIDNESYPLVPKERLDHIRPMLKLQERDSLFLNTLAVHENIRRQGVGTRLLSWARSRARSLNRPSLSLHVWADNTTARDFYRKLGFIERGIAEIPSHPRLRHSGGSVLMSLAVQGRSGIADE
jgi:ribosomal protein S18 acetylase RimI-like enzyme